MKVSVSPVDYVRSAIVWVTLCSTLHTVKSLVHTRNIARPYNNHGRFLNRRTGVEFNFAAEGAERHMYLYI